MKPPAIETPHLLFSQSSAYRAPVFQRLYVWGETELNALIEDIISGDAEAAQFLGAIVLVDLGKPKGATSPSSYLIIDGQQRLTTLYMILAAIAELARKHGEPNTADYIRDEYLAQSKSPEYKGQPKLIPTFQDRTTLWEILKVGQPGIAWDFRADPGDGNAHRPPLESQWKRVIRAVEALIVDKAGKLVPGKLDEILQHLQNGLTFITITLHASDDANVIFNKLNAKGLPLGLADLVRNEVFSKFGPDRSLDAERFYADKWHPFERQFTKNTLDIYVPVYSYVVFKGQVTKSAAFPELQKRWSKKTADDVLADLAVYAPYFQALWAGRPPAGLGPGLGAMVDRFSRMPRSVVTWPYLVQLLARAHREGDEPMAVKCLAIVESFLVRRALFGVEPTGLHAVFKGLWGAAGIDPKVLREKITTRTITCPSNEELLDKLTTEPSDSRAVLPYVLGEYERDYRRSHRFDPITDTVATVEHIMPKSRGAGWPRVEDAKRYDALVGQMGNLVPLSESQNKSMRDQPWDDKRTRFRGSNFFTTQLVAETDTWNDEAIQERTEALGHWIISRWPSLSDLAKEA